MKPKTSQPSLAITTTCLVVVLFIWGYVRLVALPNTFVPLTFVIPLMLCVWSRRVWQLFGMAVVFSAITVAKIIYVIPEGMAEKDERQVWLVVTLVNVWVGTWIVRLIMRLRDRLEGQNDILQQQHVEIEAQAEELAQQNEELRAQSEELTRQNEEIEAQSEEMQSQNEDLKDTSQRLEQREELLQGLLEASRAPGDGIGPLNLVCRHTLSSLREPAEGVALLAGSDGLLKMVAQFSRDGKAMAAGSWSRKGSLAGMVLDHNKTAYVSDFRAEPSLAEPWGADGAVRSAIATPIAFAGTVTGVLTAFSTRAGDWTQDQFKILEWTAAQCALVLEANRLQKAVSDRAHEIEKASRAKDDFIAMLSHELRTPLTPVLAAASELEKDPSLPSHVREDMRMIRRNVDIQSRLVDDLLDLTKIVRGKLEINQHFVNLQALLKDAIAIVKPEADMKRQTIVFEGASDKECWVKGDAARLHQVFWNLLKNAVRYSSDGLTIRVSRLAFDAPTRRLAVTITDSGIGISAADLLRIFRPFEQGAAGARCRSGDGGLGLGLAIANAIVEMHGGSIRAESAGAGLGSKFTVVLPAAEPPPSVPSEILLRPAQTKEAQLKILLVEDHGDTGRIIARLLRSSGYLVEHAESAEQARLRFEEIKFDLLVSDLGLPDESGIDLMRRLRTIRPELRGICLSGYGMEQDLAACRAVGFTEHLTKPVDIGRLRAAITRACATPANGDAALK